MRKFIIIFSLALGMPTVAGADMFGGDTAVLTQILANSLNQLAELQRTMRLYGEAEIAIVPSLYEGFSLPAIEAMSCGVPVVATTGGALPEVVGVSGETGILVEPNNPEALVVAIGQLLDDPALRARLGAARRTRVMERFTWQVTARGTAACYDAILTGRPLPDAMEFD